MFLVAVLTGTIRFANSCCIMTKQQLLMDLVWHLPWILLCLIHHFGPKIKFSHQNHLMGRIKPFWVTYINDFSLQYSFKPNTRSEFEKSGLVKCSSSPKIYFGHEIVFFTLILALNEPLRVKSSYRIHNRENSFDTIFWLCWNFFLEIFWMFNQRKNRWNNLSHFVFRDGTVII